MKVWKLFKLAQCILLVQAALYAIFSLTDLHYPVLKWISAAISIVMEIIYAVCYVKIRYRLKMNDKLDFLDKYMFWAILIGFAIQITVGLLWSLGLLT